MVACIMVVPKPLIHCSLTTTSVNRRVCRRCRFSPVLDRRVVEKCRDLGNFASHQLNHKSLRGFSLQRKSNRHRMILWFWTRPAINATP